MMALEIKQNAHNKRWFVAIVGRKLSLKIYRFSIQIKQNHDTPEIRLLGTDAHFEMFILTA